MRILIISNYYPPLELGGWPQLTRDIAERLSKRGHKILVLTSRHQKERIQTPEPNVLRVLHLQSPDHEHYHAWYTLSIGWRDRQNARYLEQAAANFSPDVVFIHGLWNMSRQVAAEAEKLYPDKVVYYIANTWPTDTEAPLAYWSSPAATPWLRFPKNVTGLFVRKTLLSRPSVENLKFRRVLCVSRFIQNYLVEQVGLSFEQTRVIHNGVDPDVFSPQRQTRANHTLRLLYAGGLWEHKGIPTAIEGIGHLVNHLGIKGIHLTLVGSGHPLYVKRLQDQIHDLGIEQFVSFGERVPRSQMPALLNAYDVLLFPSTGPEAMPRIVQEAMACERLVIGSSAGGTPEILQDGENGLVFAPGDYQMLARKIALAVSDPDLRYRLSRAARQTVEQRFTMEGMVDTLEKYFTTL